VIIAPPPEHLEVLFIQFYAESNSALLQEIQKLDACDPKYRRRLRGADSSASAFLSSAPSGTSNSNAIFMALRFDPIVSPRD